MTPHEVELKMLNLKHARAERDRAWVEAERHMRIAEEYGNHGGSCASIAASEHSTDEQRLAYGRKIPLYRALYLAHLRMAREFARDSGVDVEGMEVPDV